MSWRLIRYYQCSEAYQRKGPPNRVLRILGPALLADTLVLPHLVGHARGLRHLAFSHWVHRSRQAVPGSMVRQLIVLASLGAAGCSPGALYRHFATKTDLLAAATQERLPNLRDQLGDLLGRVGSSSVERNLEHIIQATQRFVAELVPIVTAVGADRELRAGWRRAFDGDVIPPRETLDTVAAYIAAEQRIGRVGAHASPLMSASMLIGACFSNAIVEHTFGETAHGMSPERHARALARAIWKGLAP